MKKYRLLVVVMLALPLTGFAQTFSMVDTARTTYGSSADANLTNPVQIVNNTSDVLPITWERFNESMTAGWDISNCTPDGCIPIGGPSTGSYNLDTINSLSDYHNCHFYPNGLIGSGQASIRIENTNTNEESIVTWYAFAGQVGVNESVMSTLTVLSISGEGVIIQGDFSALQQVQASVYNTAGQLVEQVHVENQQQIPILGLNNGYYFVHITSNEGLSITQKVVISK